MQPSTVLSWDLAIPGPVLAQCREPLYLLRWGTCRGSTEGQRGHHVARWEVLPNPGKQPLLQATWNLGFLQSFCPAQPLPWRTSNWACVEWLGEPTRRAFGAFSVLGVIANESRPLCWRILFQNKHKYIAGQMGVHEGPSLTSQPYLASLSSHCGRPMSRLLQAHTTPPPGRLPGLFQLGRGFC